MSNHDPWRVKDKLIPEPLPPRKRGKVERLGEGLDDDLRPIYGCRFPCRRGSIKVEGVDAVTIPDAFALLVRCLGELRDAGFVPQGIGAELDDTVILPTPATVKCSTLTGGGAVLKFHGVEKDQGWDRLLSFLRYLPPAGIDVIRRNGVSFTLQP